MAASLAGRRADRGLTIARTPKPVPASDEVSVRVLVTSVTAGDVIVRKMPRLLARALRVGKTNLGHEFAGRIETTGEAVTRFPVGARVFGTTSGLSVGAHAEYVSVPEDGVLARIPDGVSFEEAAPVPVGGMAAEHFLTRGGLRSGIDVLIYGASGSVGTFAVQLAVRRGARVTAVCSARSAELVRSLGASRIIDYAEQDFRELPERYDLVFDAVGKASDRQARLVLAPQGSFVSVRMKGHESAEALNRLAAQLADGGIRAVVDRRFTFEDLDQAFSYVERGQKQGNVLIMIPERT